MNRIMRAPAVARKVGLSQSTIYRLVKRGEFPQKRKIGKRAVGWQSDEVQAWVDQHGFGGGIARASPKKKKRRAPTPNATPAANRTNGGFPESTEVLEIVELLANIPKRDRQAALDIASNLINKLCS